jgi:nitronate monooxygenase
VRVQTRITQLLGIDYPVISAPMGPDMSGPDLVGAVSNAGAFGILQAQFAPPHGLCEEIRKTRELTSKPFGVNFLLHFPVEEQIAACLDEPFTALSFFWGDPSPFVEPAHDAGKLVIHQVGSVEDAERAAEAGVDLIIAQGYEAGGHVAGVISTMALVPEVVDAVSPTPVAAAGGIVDARGVAAALALGAQAAVLGTRFLASEESRAHPEYKQKLLGAVGEDTVHTILFGHGWPHAPVRTLRTAFVEEWLGNVARAQESRPDEPIVGHTTIAGQEMPVLRFMGMPPNQSSSGDIELRSLLAGQAVGGIHDIKPAQAIVRELVEGLNEILERNAGK